jgi:hypothetical protein
LDITSNGWAWALNLLTWVLGMLLGALVAGLAVWLGGLLVADWLKGPGPQGEVQAYIIAFAVVLAVFYLVLTLPFIYSKVVSPPFALCAFLGLLGAFAALLTEVFPLVFPGAGLLVLLALLLWFGFVNKAPYKLRFPGMSMYYPGGSEPLVPLRQRAQELYAGPAPPSPPLGPTEAMLLDDGAALEGWRQTVLGPAPAGALKPRLIIVSVSGGAAKAAFWTAVVLDRLEQEVPNFGRHVRIITGASGGMLGAAYYVRHRQQVAIPNGKAAPWPWVEHVPWDSLGPLARHIALREVWQALLPRLGDGDRGTCLEEDWKDIGLPLQHFGDLEARGEVPSLIFSPMMVDDGRRLLVSNLDLWELTRSCGGALTFDDPGLQQHNYSLSALEFYRLFPQAKDFCLATAVRMNASFPYVSPSVNLPTDPPRRIVDAGYYDNYGIQVASAWAYKNLDWLARHTSGVLLVQVRASMSQKERLEIADAPRGFWAHLSRGFQFFTSPPDGGAMALTASASFRNDEDVQNLSDLFTARMGGDRGFFTTVVFENSADVTFSPPAPGAWPGDAPVAAQATGNVALNWYLSRAERAGLLAAIPRPLPGSRWQDQANRIERIKELQRKADVATGEQRDGVLKQLEQAKNYERLVRLKEWWARH